MEELLYSLVKDDLWSYGRYAARTVCMCVSVSARDIQIVRLFECVLSMCVCCVCRALRNLGVCFGCDKVDNECQ